jgi:hypothetical protein
VFAVKEETLPAAFTFVKFATPPPPVYVIGAMAGYWLQETIEDVKEDVEATGAPLSNSVGVEAGPMYPQSIVMASNTIFVVMSDEMFRIFI